MFQKERRIIVSVIGSILILIFYSLYIYKNNVDGNIEVINDTQFWGKSFMWFILVGIILQIVIHIIFSIITKIVTNEDVEMMNDERDKLIELKALRVSHWTMVVGFILAMASQAMGMQIHIMFMILIGSLFLGGTLDEITKLYLYRKGF